MPVEGYALIACISGTAPMIRDAFEVVCQHMQTHLGTHTREPLGEEMRRAHPRLERAERVVYRRLVSWQAGCSGRETLFR